MAALSTTMANPVWIQIMTTMSSTVLMGSVCIHCTGSPPNATTSALRRPICSRSPERYSYTNRQMMPAPTKEMAIGMKTRAL